MRNLHPIGTFLFNKKFNKVGMVIGYSSGNTWYDVDSDDDMYWGEDDGLAVITEKEVLFYKLRYG